MSALPLFDTYPRAAGFKRKGTSSEAAAKITPTLNARQARVLNTLHMQDMTPDECASKLGLSLLSVRPRFSELQAQGLIEQTGIRRRNASGMTANVYRVKPKGE